MRMSRIVVLLLLAVTVALCAPGLVMAQTLTTDEAGVLVLNAGRRAYNEQNFPVAIDRFREFLKTCPNHKEAPSAQYALALCLLEQPAKDCKGAADTLAPVIANAAFPDRPFALYYAGVAQRGQGTPIIAQIAARPNEAAALREQAKPFFEAARVQFAAATAALVAAKADPQWVDLSRCDQCEMLLNMARHKEAFDLATAALADPAAAKSRYRPLMLYHLGYAAFGLKDYQAAGKAMSQLAPFNQEFGVHARYLLARSLQLGGDRAEAAVQYKAVTTTYEEQKKAAQEALKTPAALKPDQKAALERLVNTAAPDYVGRSTFYLAVMQAEDGNAADALAKLTTLAQQYPNSPFAKEIQLRQGYCHLQSRAYPQAVQMFQPLVDHPQLGDLACWWLAKAQIGAADPANPAVVDQATKAAIEVFRRASDKATQLAATDPSAKVRRADMLLDLADAQVQTKQYKEAAATYLQVQTENAAPDRVEQAMHRQAMSMHLAGQVKEADDLCQKFEKTYPKSTLLGGVVFREAETAFQVASAAAANASLSNREQELAKLFGEAITRYQRVLAQFPDVPHVQNARLGLAMSQYRLGKWPEAAAALTAIPEPDRNGDLAVASYLLADCLLRTMPPEGDDALQGAKHMAQAEQAGRLLETFIGASPKAPQVPDAMLKLADCYQRVAVALADPAERGKKLQSARETCEKCQQQFPQDPGLPGVVLERAKVLALQGDAGNAINELNRFRSDPLANSPVAPLAIIRLAPLLRAQGKAADAATALTECRTRHEGALAKDPARADWLGLLLYEQAVATKESGKLADARATFETLAKQYAGKGEGLNASWRLAQCRREELVAAAKPLRDAITYHAKPEDIAKVRAPFDEAVKGLREAAGLLKAAADETAKKGTDKPSLLRMLYELAWCHRALADQEIAVAREQAQKDALERIVAKLKKEGQPVPADLAPPEVPLTDLPIQPSEKAAMDLYKALAAADEDAPLAMQARFELAEMQAARNQHEAAMELLAEVLENNPSQETAERARLKLAASLLARKDGKAALAQALVVVKKPTSALAAEAKYLAAEACIAQQDWPKAIEQLTPFRDQPPFQNIYELTDRALLRLGYAYAQSSQWEPSRQCYEVLVQRFPNSQWVHQARYGWGWALQSQKQYDGAAQLYLDVTKRSASETAARAQLQVGLCRMEQKKFEDAAKALMVVSLTYDYPELSAQSLFEAGNAYTELKQPTEAAAAWQKVVSRFPSSSWAKTAQAKLGEKK